VLRQREQRIFAADSSLRRRARGDDALAQPGFVGRRYKPGGILFIGANPGGSKVQALESDTEQNELIRKLRRADDLNCLVAFEHLMRHLRIVMPAEWRIYRNCVERVLRNTHYTVDDIAYLNLVKWRTRNERLTADVVDSSWQSQTSYQVAALQPQVVIAMGAEVGRRLRRLGVSTRLFVLKRIIGDRNLTPEGIVEARRARAWIQRRV
jgi:hypothetical protein